MSLDNFQDCFSQDDEEIDGLVDSFLSQARTTGVARSKVGCLYLGMVEFDLNWFCRGGTRTLQRAANPRRSTARIPGRILTQGPPGLPSGLTLGAVSFDVFSYFLVL